MVTDHSIIPDAIIESLKSSEKNGVCIVANNISYTYEQLLNDVSKAEPWLQSMGINAQTKIVMAVPASYEFLIAFYALYRRGVTMALIDPQMGRKNYNALCKQFEPDTLVADSRIVLLNEHPVARWIIEQLNTFLPSVNYNSIKRIITTGKKLPILQKHFHLDKRRGYNSSPLRSHPSETTLLTYTSGTLGQPKGVEHTASSLVNSLAVVNTMLNKERDKRLATHLPHFMLIFTYFGGETHLWPENLSAKQRYHFIEKHRITTFFGPPSEILPLVNYAIELRIKLPSVLKHIILGSAPTHTSFLEKLSGVTEADITCIYGMTENLVASTANGKEKQGYKGIGDFVGRIVPGVKIKINDDHEILIQSPQLFRGYHLQEPRQGWHHTGDLGRVENNNLILIGRKKDMIIRKNKNIYPALYEPIITQIAGIDEAALVGIYDEKSHDEEVFLVVDSKENIDVVNLKKLLSHGPFQIDKDVLPDKIFQMPIPKTGRQLKVDKVKLKELLKARI